MKTQPIKYSDVKIGDKIFYKEKDHERRKLNFQEIEEIVEIEKYLSRGLGNLVKLTFKSNNQTLGIENIELNKIIE